jgi:signal peptidase I
MRRLIRTVTLCLGLGLLGTLVALSMTTNHSYVTTPSMYPTIPPGSQIVVEPQAQYRVGDVIEFRANGLTWAHRLVGIRPDGSYITKGDNPQNSPDVFVPALTRADVIGKVVHAPRWLGFPELILHRPGYGLAWLRTELGISGRVALTVVGALVAFGLALRPRPVRALAAA